MPIKITVKYNSALTRMAKNKNPDNNQQSARMSNMNCHVSSYNRFENSLTLPSTVEYKHTLLQ